MTETQAKTWIKSNWNFLINQGRLDEALRRYFKKYSWVDSDNTDEVLDIFDGKL